MSWQIRISNSSRKNLKRFPIKDREKIKAVLEQLNFNPFFGDIEKMKGESNSWRRRIGSYRIFYDIDKKKEVINITHIKRRTTDTY